MKIVIVDVHKAFNLAKYLKYKPIVMNNAELMLSIIENRIELNRCREEALELLNKLFKDVNLYKSLQCIGKHSENLLPSLQSSSSGKIIENELIPIILKKFSWSMYIGKACKSKYLGATFYEPLLAGIPVFIWEGTDPEHKIFPDIDCYFKNGEELISKVHTYDSIKMKELFIKQINSIYDSKI